VIDQTNKSGEAVYWKDDFLKLKIRNDSYNQTHNVLGLYKNFVTEKISEDFEISKPDKIDLLNKSMKYFKEKEKFDFEEFSVEVIGNETASKSFKSMMSNYEQEFETPLSNGFDISAQAVKKQNSNYKTVLKLDNNINLKLDGINDFNLKSSSSCLIKGNNNSGYKLNIRYINYNIQPNGSYTDCDKHIITVNKYVEFDNNFNITTEKWMNTQFEDRQYVGIEDVRIWEQNADKTSLQFIGTGYHKNNKIGIVAGKYDLQNQKFEFNEIVPDFNNASCEKNWVYTEYNNETHVIYKWNPLQICKINEENNSLKLVEERKMPNIFSHVRGSSCGFTYKKQLVQNSTNNNDNIQLLIEEKEIWFITHLVSYENPRHYYHLIAVFDENMNLLRYSAPFKFEGEPIEYSLSIVVEDDDVFINYSTWDRTTRIGVYDKKYIDSIVKYT